MNIKFEEIGKALDWMRDNARSLAQAKAQRIYLENFRKSKKALLFIQSPQGTIADRENWAYAHDDYLEILKGLEAAVEKEEELRFMMKAAELKVEVWRTQEATNRAIDRSHQ